MYDEIFRLRHKTCWRVQHWPCNGGMYTKESSLSGCVISRPICYNDVVFVLSGLERKTNHLVIPDIIGKASLYLKSAGFIPGINSHLYLE